MGLAVTPAVTRLTAMGIRLLGRSRRCREMVSGRRASSDVLSVVPWTCLTQSCLDLRRGTGGDRDPMRWGGGGAGERERLYLTLCFACIGSYLFSEKFENLPLIPSSILT